MLLGALPLKPLKSGSRISSSFSYKQQKRGMRGGGGVLQKGNAQTDQNEKTGEAATHPDRSHAAASARLRPAVPDPE